MSDTLIIYDQFGIIQDLQMSPISQTSFLVGLFLPLLTHCNRLQGNYRVELLHREISVVITGNEFTEYNFLLFWLHFFPCFKVCFTKNRTIAVHSYILPCTEVRFAFFLSGGFITVIVVNPPERKLAKRTFVQWFDQ